MSLLWDIPLGSPPHVVNIGRNAHGFEEMDRFCLPDLWSLHLYGYEASLRLDDHPLPIRPGYMGITPPGKTLETHYYGISVHIYVHFRLEAGSESVRQILAMQDLAEEYDSIYKRVYSVAGLLSSEPERVNARIWDLLWDRAVVQKTLHTGSEIHPAVRMATEIISRDLSHPISVDKLAQEVGVSYSYLARLFQDAFGETVVAYVRNRRLERAVHLLERSTLPIKAIAASVGIPDLQHFNKAVRLRFGRSPRSIREFPSHVKNRPPLLSGEDDSRIGFRRD